MNDNDLQHLKYLRTAYIVNAGILFLIALLPVVHLVVGIGMIAGMFEDDKDPPPEFLGYFFVAIAVILIALFGTLAILNLFAARALGAQKNWVFCVAMAAVNLMFSPFGIIIGVFSLVVLLRESVKQLFERNAQPISGQMPDWR